MLASEKLAIAAHLHVLLRRKTGRVTDTEWMAQNLDYAAEVVRFARARSVEDGAPELAEWAARLEQAMLQPAAAARVPLAQAALGALRQARGPEPPSTVGDSLLEPDPAPAAPAVPSKYVGGIR